MQLQQGEKRGLADLGVGGQCTVKVDFGLSGLDVAAFGLDKGQKIGDDRYVVLFSNPSTPNNEVSLNAASDTAVFNINLDALPAATGKVGDERYVDGGFVQSGVNEEHPMLA